MKKALFIVFTLWLFCNNQSIASPVIQTFAAVSSYWALPQSAVKDNIMLQKGLEVHLGRKLNFYERILFRKLQKKLDVDLSPEEEADMLRNKKLANFSLYAGIGAVVLLFIPTIGVLSFLLFPTALVLGILAISRAGKYGNRANSGQTSAIIGTILGGGGILLILAAIIALATLWVN